MTCLFHGTPRRTCSERSERNSDCCALRQSRLRKTKRCLRTTRAMHEHCVLVLFAMSTSHDFGKCCALASLFACGQRKVLSPPVRYDKTAILIAVFEWYTQADLNRQPSESESDALSSCAMGAYRRFCFVRLNYSTLVRISKPTAKFLACNILVTYRYVDDIIISTTKFGLNRVGKTDFTIN